MPNLYENPNGTEFAVLISPGWGAGWSTWAEPEIAYDKRVVEFWLSHKDDEKFMRTVSQWGLSEAFPESDAHAETVQFFESIGYRECPYLGGFNNLKLVWVPYGSLWRIREYDGAESIEFLEDAGFTCFNKSA